MEQVVLIDRTNIFIFPYQALDKDNSGFLDREEFPKSFRETLLFMIWKQKGAMDILKNNRFIHLKQVLARAVDAINVTKMKDTLVENASIFQVGGLPGHSIKEHLITLKTVMARMESTNKGIIFLIVDIISFFDKEDIFDCLETMEEINVNKKAARIWYLMNRSTKITVKTPCGNTESAELSNCVGQGSASAGLVSATNLDRGIQKWFNESDKVMSFNTIRIQPMSYQDDTGSICDGAIMARDQAKRIDLMLREKVLDAHPDKSGYLLLGSNKFINNQKKEINKNPIKFEQFDLKEKMSDKYLGQVIEKNLAKSALATVQDRSGKIKGAAIEIKSIIEDYKMQHFGGLMAAWELWERALVPSLLSGAGTWLGLTKETIDLCDNLQNFYWRVILKVPQSCPKVALLCETSTMGMKWRIWERKCLLLKQILELEDTALAKIITKEADENGWPGLAQEVRKICHDINIPDINSTIVTKRQIKQAIYYSHYNNMKENTSNSNKLEDIKYEDFHSFRPYFNYKNINNARMAFRIRTNMVENIPANFKGKYDHENDLLCKFCPNVQFTQTHSKACPGMKEIRNDLNMNNMEDLVIFFNRYLEEESRKK